MKSMFKKVLHVLLAIAIIYACPFSVHAADGGVSTCGFGDEIDIPDAPTYCNKYGCLLSTTGQGEPYWVDGGNADLCYRYDAIQYLKCGICDAEYEETITVDESSSHNMTTDLDDLGDGKYLETTYCTECGYVESSNHYELWSLR